METKCAHFFYCFRDSKLLVDSRKLFLHHVCVFVDQLELQRDLWTA